jgi:hypothetical protein
LIDGNFGSLATELYGPILAALVKPKERSTLKP